MLRHPCSLSPLPPLSSSLLILFRSLSLFLSLPVNVPDNAPTSFIYIYMYTFPHTVSFLTLYPGHPIVLIPLGFN